MAHNSKEEPKTAPQPDRWYNLTLGSSFKDDATSKYCTLRYEFKPASIDKTKAGSLHKNKENRVSAEFQNNQLGKPKVTFEGSSEDYKENDAVLFFDGHSFRLERLHRAVKQLRYVRKSDESTANAAVASASQSQSGSVNEPLPLPPPPSRSSPPFGRGVKSVHVSRSAPAFPPVPVEVERIDVAADSQIPGAKGPNKGISENAINMHNVPNSTPSPKNDEVDDHIDIEDIFGSSSPYDNNDQEKGDDGFDTHSVRHNDTDDEIADVDDSGDEVDKGPRNAAEALRAQVNAEGRNEQSSSSSSSSGSGSSSSGSSSSSDSDGSDEDSVNSI